MQNNTWVPHDYQKVAYQYLIDNPFSGLFLDPGLGKTSITLNTINHLIDDLHLNSVLIVAPKFVMYEVWPLEIEKWSNFKHMTHLILHGKNKKKLWEGRKDIYLINPEGLKWLVKELHDGLTKGKKLPFDALWVDESTKFKNPKSGQFKLLSSMSVLFKRRHIMTGTPTPKSYQDLWSQLYICDEGLTFGKSFYKFRKRYFEPTDYMQYNWKVRDTMAGDLKRTLSNSVLDMSAKDYIKLPGITINNIYVTLTEKVYKYYKDMEKDFFLNLDVKGDQVESGVKIEISAGAAAQASMKCHQIAQGCIYEDVPELMQSEEEIREFKKTRKSIDVHNSKIEALLNLIDELNGKPLLISYYYKHDLLRLRQALGEDTPHIGSGVSTDDVNRYIKEWNERKLPVLIGNPLSMSHGLNMQKGGHDICWFTMTWDYDVYTQYNARLYRQGVEKKVRIHNIICKDTVDEAMLLRLSDRGSKQTTLREDIRRYRENKNR